MSRERDDRLAPAHMRSDRAWDGKDGGWGRGMREMMGEGKRGRGGRERERERKGERERMRVIYLGEEAGGRDEGGLGRVVCLPPWRMGTERGRGRGRHVSGG